MSIERENKMNKIDEVAEVDEFLAGPLVNNWFASCLEMITDEELTYDDLVNGYLMHNVFLEMNLTVVRDNVDPSTVNSAALRSHNLEAVLDNVRRFYEDELGQVILRLPDVEKLGREPEHHVRETEILLVLLLGCAVQCPKKQAFIERITRMDEDSQMAVAECIAQVIKVPGIVLSLEMLTDSSNAQKVIDCVRQLRQERDEYKTQLRRHRELEAEQSGDELCEKMHQLKYKLASLEDQLREKGDELDDAKDELRESEMKMREIGRVNEKLVLESKNANYYRDELDVAVEQAKRLEQEVAGYRKKLTDFDKCRARLKELESRSKDKAEVQVASKKLEKDETIRDLRRQVNKLTERMRDLTVENDETRSKYWAVCEEKTELQRLVKAPYEGIPSLKDNTLIDHANSQLTKLRSDNESLIAKLNQTLFDKSTVTQDNKKLLQIVDALKARITMLTGNYDREVNRSKSLEYICKAALNEATKLQKQGLEHLRSLLENAQQQSTESCEKSTVMKNSNGVGATKVPAEPKCNVVRSRKLLKYVKTQA